MFKFSEVLWLNTCPNLLRFNLPTIKYLSHYVAIAQWEYRQNLDEASSLDIALNLLDDYLKMSPKSVHLVGHSTCGLLGLLYARKHPEKVRSLTLLGVGVNPRVDWVNYYYILRKSLPCSRQLILARIAKNVFGNQALHHRKAYIQVLDKALTYSLSPHSLYQTVNIPAGGISQPLMICGSEDDRIIPPEQLNGWQAYLKEGDRLWKCPQGRHFFHYFQPQQIGDALLKFWCSSTGLKTHIFGERSLKSVSSD